MNHSLIAAQVQQSNEMSPASSFLLLVESISLTTSAASTTAEAPIDVPNNNLINFS